MKDKVVNYFINKLKINNNLNDIKLEEIKYGLLGLYSLISKTFVVILIALILGIFKEFIMFLLFYSILRAVGYGTHAKSNIACWISSILFLIGFPYIFSFLKLNIIVKLIIWFLGFFCFLLFCPADTEKKPMINKQRKIKFKISMLLIDVIYLILLLKFPLLSNYIIAAIILQVFLSSPIGYLFMGHKIRFSLNDIYLLNKNKEGVK